MDYDCVAVNWIVFLNWTAFFKCLEIIFAVIWHNMNKTELNEKKEKRFPICFLSNEIHYWSLSFCLSLFFSASFSPPPPSVSLLFCVPLAAGDTSIDVSNVLSLISQTEGGGAQQREIMTSIWPRSTVNTFLSRSNVTTH